MRLIHCNNVAVRLLCLIEDQYYVQKLEDQPHIISISRLGETRPEQEWSNGTEFSANLARYTQNFGKKFRKMSVPFAPQPGISGIFGRMEGAPGDFFRCAPSAENLLRIFKTDSVQSSSNTCKNYLLKVYSQHGNFLNAI